MKIFFAQAAADTDRLLLHFLITQNGTVYIDDSTIFITKLYSLIIGGQEIDEWIIGEHGYTLPKLAR